ncbi:MAG: hypothetical protein JJU32_20395 [Phormidium sp. BM_Day4_Bin.17]|nr:hypothetical protein [Phormidium sp. BM_Day4_Bin.17]UCJ11997.1 MAG: hypothetical protein JWS08_20160 [Phormidium sp. PBR-2020]
MQKLTSEVEFKFRRRADGAIAPSSQLILAFSAPGNCFQGTTEESGTVLPKLD